MTSSPVMAYQRFLTHGLADELALERELGQPDVAALALFQRMAQSVPAYGRWLAEQRVDAASIRHPQDLTRIPVMTKQNYIKRFALAERCRGGTLDGCEIVAASSGSTGAPTFWPRSAQDEYRVARRFEQVLVDAFGADQRRTLAVVCFAMGSWVGGLYTTNCCRLLAARGLPVTVVAPGNNRDEILRVVPQLAPAFEQVVLLGYPPFLRDVLDSGERQGIDWASYRLKWVSAGEVFSEAFRDLMARRSGSNQPLYDSAALYGTADGGVLGNETPLSIAIRRQLSQRPDVAKALFGESRMPTLVQYDPYSRFFQVEDGMLLISAEGKVPLFRYGILDSGGVFGYQELLDALAQHGLEPLRELVAGRPVRELPFVYVFGRADFTVSFYGANVFPENVSVALEVPEFARFTTAKFVLEVAAPDQEGQQPELQVAVELAQGATAAAGAEAALQQAIMHELARQNSEWQQYVPAERKRPRVTFYPYGDPHYFPLGVKHRYTRSQ